MAVVCPERKPAVLARAGSPTDVGHPRVDSKVAQRSQPVGFEIASAFPVDRGLQRGGEPRKEVLAKKSASKISPVSIMYSIRWSRFAKFKSTKELFL